MYETSGYKIIQLYTLKLLVCMFTFVTGVFYIGVHVCAGYIGVHVCAGYIGVHVCALCNNFQEARPRQTTERRLAPLYDKS